LPPFARSPVTATAGFPDYEGKLMKPPLAEINLAQMAMSTKDTLSSERRLSPLRMSPCSSASASQMPMRGQRLMGSCTAAGADQWVGSYIAPHLVAARTATYLGRVIVDFAQCAESLQSVVLANAPYSERAAAAIESGDLVRAAEGIYRIFDRGRGFLSRGDGSLCAFAQAVFRHFALEPPKGEQLWPIVALFDDGRGTLSGSQCICLVDALFRSVFRETTGIRICPSNASIESAGTLPVRRSSSCSSVDAGSQGGSLREQWPVRLSSKAPPQPKRGDSPGTFFVDMTEDAA